MMKSSHIGVCSKATTGGALVLLAVMGEPCLSRYDNILWMMAGSIMQAIIVTLCFWHFSHSVMSILKTRSYLPVTGLGAHVIPLAWYGLSD